ncbi:hypothetical protein YPPY66_0569 [Yersinia pestis PY-66]|uniref:Uncharacterized protein n=3 Tax=Yersinia pestis TaxID=632 RepID=Q8CLQ3_YERPE|nr:hypothetical [Yersinia pestis KIM10+]ABG15909.1 conserved hypothetical protein [Yersinia pestis Antiqua]ABG19663.1 conserved hypothetical protein [Yersinia pestis Nepal516]ABP41988.1 conserved hypothetical protein [Yersinia pestis Pestoides F]ADV97372.1 hypothetical protein YPC_0669 [Yersinia pestis biovar Medievalis str. Harbin 35]EEO82646.1 hypothetical protein YPF_0615 [Yersinia pestis biovar Orientalis str. India 195]EEO86614.1 hypothetical protein YPH_2532 [Yersinia pestis biovar Orie
MLVWVWLRNICYRYVLSIIAKYYLLLKMMILTGSVEKPARYLMANRGEE